MALRAIVGKCLEPEPARRYADAGQLAGDLDRFLSGHRVRADKLRPCRIFAGRGAAPATIALSIALLAAAGLVVGRRMSGRLAPLRIVGPEPSLARRDAERRERERRYIGDLRLLADLAPREPGASTYRLAMARTIVDRYWRRGPEDDLRTWEWYHFQRMLHGERTTLAGHRGAVYHLEYSRDGKRLGSSGTDGVHVRDVATGAPVLTLRAHSDDVNWVAFSPDGSRLATASDDRTVGIWDAADGRRLLPPLIHREKVVVVLFTPGGRRLVSGDRGAIVTTWDGTTGAAVGSRKLADGSLEGMGLSPDGSVLAVAANGEVTLWDYPAMGRRLVRIRGDDHGPQFDGVAFSRDGRRFATAGGAVNHVRVWDVEGGRLVRSLLHHADERVFTVAFSPDDRRLLSTGSDDAVRLWDLADGGCEAILAGHSQWVWSGAWAPDGRSVATGAGDGAIKLWGIPHLTTAIRFEEVSSPCLALAFFADGRSLLTVTTPGHLETWGVAPVAGPTEMNYGPRVPLVDGTLAPGATLAAAVDARGTLTVGGPSMDRPVLTIPRAAGARPCLTFSKDGKALAYIAADGAVTRLDATAPTPSLSILGSLSSAPSALAFAPDGSVLAGDIDGRLFAFNRESGATREAVERGHWGRITRLVVSPDGSLCASGGGDASIVLWDRNTGRIRARLSGHHHPIDDLAFTPDGKTLISAADSIQLWNVATAQPTIILEGGLEESDPPGRLAVSPDGTAIGAVVVKDKAFRVAIWIAERPGEE